MMNSQPITTNPQRYKSTLVVSPTLHQQDIDDDCEYRPDTLEDLNDLFSQGYTPVHTTRIYGGEMVFVTLAARDTSRPSEGQKLPVQYRCVSFVSDYAGAWHSKLFVVDIDQLEQLYANGFEPVEQTAMDRGKSVLITLRIRDALPLTDDTFKQLHQ